MNFVFLAAGKGTRIFKKIKTNKCLIKLNKKTIIEKLIENIPKKYNKKITIVTGFNHSKIIKATKKYGINYLQNKDYKNTEMLHSLSLALREINDDIFFSYSDIIYDKTIIKDIIQKKIKNICVPINMKWKKVWEHRGTDIKSDAETLDFKNNKLLATYTLNQKISKKINGTKGETEIIIDNGRARFASSPCPKKYCIHQAWINKANQTVVCIPNKISISIIGKDKTYDSISY